MLRGEKSNRRRNITQFTHKNGYTNKEALLIIKEFGTS